MNKRLISTFFLFLVILVNIASVPTTAQKIITTDRTKDLTIDTLLNNGECPFPLISLKLTNLSEKETSSCLNGCCLPCPIVNNFYKEKQIDLIYNVLSVIRVISFASTLIIVISYIVLPSKREHPAVTVLYFNMSVLIFIGVVFFYIGNLRKVQCADLVTQATMKNNTLCGIQGVILIFSSFLCILWCFFLILQLHFQTVWQSNIIQRYNTVSQSLVIIMAVTFTILPAAMNKISFEFGAVCMVTSDFANELFWYPLSVFVVPGFVIHLWTFIHIGKSQFIAVRSLAYVTGQELARALKIQWRALTLALMYLITYILYWTFAMVELLPISSEPSWFLTWLNCIFENGMKSIHAQNICSIHAKGHIPNVLYLISAELSTAMLGICIFIVFGTSTDLWTEWKTYCTEKFGSKSKTDELKDFT